MAIDNISGRMPNQPVGIKTTPPVVNKEPAAPVSTADTIVSPITERIKNAIATSSEAPMNSEKVARLKQAINEGSYQIDADRIAQKMMQFDNDLP